MLMWLARKHIGAGATCSLLRSWQLDIIRSNKEETLGRNDGQLSLLNSFTNVHTFFHINHHYYEGIKPIEWEREWNFQSLYCTRKTAIQNQLRHMMRDLETTSLKKQLKELRILGQSKRRLVNDWWLLSNIREMIHGRKIWFVLWGYK